MYYLDQPIARPSHIELPTPETHVTISQVVSGIRQLGLGLLEPFNIYIEKRNNKIYLQKIHKHHNEKEGGYILAGL